MTQENTPHISGTCDSVVLDQGKYCAFGFKLADGSTTRFSAGAAGLGLIINYLQHLAAECAKADETSDAMMAAPSDAILDVAAVQVVVRNQAPLLWITEPRGRAHIFRLQESQTREIVKGLQAAETLVGRRH